MNKYKYEIKPCYGICQSSEGAKFRDHRVLNNTDIVDLLNEGQEAKIALAEIRDALYGKGLQVYGWHLNGDLISMDDLFDEGGWSNE